MAFWLKSQLNFALTALLLVSVSALAANEIAPDVYFVIGDCPGDLNVIRPILCSPKNTVIGEKTAALISELRRKGYRVHVQERIEANDLALILSDPLTRGVFNFSHGSFTADGHGPYLRLYREGHVFPLMPEAIEEAKTHLGTPYEPGKNLDLFYNAACYGGQCETDLREGFKLPKSVKYIAPAGAESINAFQIARSLGADSQIQKWVDALPDLQGKVDPKLLTKLDQATNALKAKELLDLQSRVGMDPPPSLVSDLKPEPKVAKNPEPKKSLVIRCRDWFRKTR